MSADFLDIKVTTPKSQSQIYFKQKPPELIRGMMISYCKFVNYFSMNVQKNYFSCLGRKFKHECITYTFLERLAEIIYMFLRSAL